MVEMDFQMGALCCGTLRVKTAFASVNFQRRGKSKILCRCLLSAVLIHRATPNQAEFEFDCISISKFLLCLCDDVCKNVKQLMGKLIPQSVRGMTFYFLSVILLDFAAIEVKCSFITHVILYFNLMMPVNGRVFNIISQLNRRGQVRLSSKLTKEERIMIKDQILYKRKLPSHPHSCCNFCPRTCNSVFNCHRRLIHNLIVDQRLIASQTVNYE
ncbi:hypothetical protein CICLE_v10003756mg [Citrus x clementina]|uniref:Uncharacterized protein n=1 Tax=Citrus clementina TaxID=85681 RepID=V4T435_CITCL|nr:hypothetical protein CICLE_v10003756mg [Citrus x clementina]